MDYVNNKFDCIVVGAGHAGCEAAIACARLGAKVLLCTLNVDNIALMPCNPAIGGPAKSTLVREIDALGGVMGEAADATYIQMKMLNSSKGPAVRALRAQSDKRLYMDYMRNIIENTENIYLKQCCITELKIENGEAVENLEEIVKASDGIMVARGDLACEIPFAKVPQVQKQIIELCDLYSKPVIIATQMLLSMVDNITPTRAEVSDVANAVYEGADAVMTSDETTKGFDPVNVINVMADIVSTNEQEYIVKTYNEEMTTDELNKELVKSSVRTADFNNAVDSIIVLTRSGNMASCVSGEKPSCPVYAFTDNNVAKNTMSLLWGVYPEKIAFDATNYESAINEALNQVKTKYNAKRCLLISYNKVNGVEYPIIAIKDL